MTNSLNPYLASTLLSADIETSSDSLGLAASSECAAVSGLSELSAPPAAVEGPKIKLLPPSVVKDIEQKNIARKLAGLSSIVIKTRRCIACGSMFESAGNRTCGCSSRTAGTIAGREII